MALVSLLMASIADAYTPQSGGTIVVVATRAQDDLYFSKSATGTMTAVKADQTITFPAIGITMNSSQRSIGSQSSSERENELQPGFEIYWQHNLSSGERWNHGVRAALWWQRIELDHRATYSTTIRTLSDTCSYEGIPPSAPFNGSFNGPNFLLSDIPTRSTSAVAGPSILARRSLDADRFGLDVGPTLSLTLTRRLQLTTSAGGTVAFINSDFSYNDGGLASGSDT